MIRQTFIILLLFCSCSNRKGSNDSINTQVDKTSDNLIKLTTDTLASKTADTIFIRREVSKEFYHAVYIDTSRHSKDYDRLTDFNFDEYDLQSYQENYKYFKEKFPNTYKAVNHSKLPNNWLPVYMYKNKYYLYAPSDWGNAGRLIINDSAFVNWQMDGIIPLSLIKVMKENRNKYTLEMSKPYKESLEKQVLEIHQIDNKTQLSVFKYLNEPKESRYQLYVPNENAKYFDMIVNYCNNQKQLEFDFDEIDYEKLIKK